MNSRETCCRSIPSAPALELRVGAGLLEASGTRVRRIAGTYESTRSSDRCDYQEGGPNLKSRNAAKNCRRQQDSLRHLRLCLDAWSSKNDQTFPVQLKYIPK